VAANGRPSWGAIFNRAARLQTRQQVLVFSLDFEDGYHPQVVRLSEDPDVAVLYRHEKQGFFDDRQQTYRRDSNGRIDTGVVLDSEPPANWLLNESPP
jgi:hypothetical protein